MINHWVLGLIALASGLLLGEIGGRIVRGSLSRPDRSDEVREMARAVGSVVFWACTAVGVFVAVASGSRETLDEVPARMAHFVPKVLVAGLIVLAGWAIAVGVSAAVGQSALRASGVRHRGLERSLRLSLVGTSVALALAQVGVDPTILALGLGVLVGGPVLALALLTAFGGRGVASQLAAGRALRQQLRTDYLLEVEPHPDRPAICGRIVTVHPVTVEVATEDGVHVHVPLDLLLRHPFRTSPLRTAAPTGTTPDR